MASSRSSVSDQDGSLELRRIKEGIDENGDTIGGDVENTGDLRYKKRTAGGVGEDWNIQTDAVFGQISEEGPNYRAVSASRLLL